MQKEETDTLTLRVPISIKVQIEIAANKDGRTINSWVNKIIREHLENAKKWGTDFSVPQIFYLLFTLILFDNDAKLSINSPSTSLSIG